MPRRHRMESKTSPCRIEAVERHRQALELRLSGANFDQIAKALGFKDRSGAYRAVEAALNRVPAPEAGEYRRVNLERLNKARMGVWKGVLGGDIKSVNAELGIQEREARYLGLDAPQRQEITGKGGGPIEHRIEDARAHILAELDAIEARIREAKE